MTAEPKQKVPPNILRIASSYLTLDADCANDIPTQPCSRSATSSLKNVR